jgi:hypothetical protein
VSVVAREVEADVIFDSESFPLRCVRIRVHTRSVERNAPSRYRPGSTCC